MIDIIHKEAIHDVLNCKKLNNILEFGCGNGRLLNLLANLGNNYYVIYITTEMINAAKKFENHFSLLMGTLFLNE